MDIVADYVAPVSSATDTDLANCANDRLARMLAVAFLLYGVIAVLLLAFLTPPFQNPDEVAHFLRGASIAEGHLIGQRFIESEPDGSHRLVAGAPSDPALVTAFLPFAPLPGQPGHRAGSEMWAPQTHWTTQRAMATFTAQAMYPPLFYLPSAAGVLIGHIARMTVVQTLTLSRVMAGLCAVALGAIAIDLGGSGAVLMFAILTLPMALSLMASVAQDGPMLGASALAAALIRRSARPGPPPAVLCAGLVMTLAALAMARPPYLALVVLFAGLRLPRAWRLWSVLAIGGAVAAWVAGVIVFTAANAGEIVGADPGAQLAYITGHLAALPSLALQTLMRHGLSYCDEFIGELGWLDTDLPAAYHDVAWLVLGLALMAACLGRRRRPTATQRSPAAAIALPTAMAIGFAVIAIFALQYLSWSPPGSATIEGVQGRYFLPLALIGVAMIPALAPARLARLRAGLVLIVAAFPAATIVITVQTVVLRYYLT